MRIVSARSEEGVKNNPKPKREGYAKRATENVDPKAQSGERRSKRNTRRDSWYNVATDG